MKKIRFGYTPDTDDAFHYYALESGIIAPAKDERFEFVRMHIQPLNEKAMDGELEVTAISSILYPSIADRYVVLSSGASVGRGYGPALCALKGRQLKSLEGLTVAAPGPHTTGYFLLRYFYSGFKTVFLPFEEVAHAVKSGEVDAGVMIHEDLLNYGSGGLERVSCLGDLWYRETGLPLPVGLVVARRDLGAERIARISGYLAASMRYAIDHKAEAMRFALTFSSGKGVTEEFVSKFANTDTEDMPADVRKGLEVLFRLAEKRGLIAGVPASEIV